MAASKFSKIVFQELIWCKLFCSLSFRLSVFSHGLAKATCVETNMFTCCVKGCSNQSRLNKIVSYHKIPGQERKDIRDAWIKAIARPVLPKAIHVCSDHFTEDLFDESQELQQRLLGGNLKYILKPDVVPSLFPKLKGP